MTSAGGNQNICVSFSWPTSSLQYCLLHRTGFLVKERSLPLPYERLFLITLLNSKSGSCYQANIVRNEQTTYWVFDLASWSDTASLRATPLVTHRRNSQCWCMTDEVLKDCVQKAKLNNGASVLKGLFIISWSVEEMRFLMYSEDRYLMW